MKSTDVFNISNVLQCKDIVLFITYNALFPAKTFNK